MRKQLAFLCSKCGAGHKTLNQFIKEQITEDNNIVKVICPECGYDPEMSFKVEDK